MLLVRGSALLRTFAALVAVLAILALAGARPAHAAVTITVNSVADDNNITNNCTLREAILAANMNQDRDQCHGAGGGPGDIIQFNLPSGTPEIDIGTLMLPDITEAVRIEGATGSVGKVVLHGPDESATSGKNGLTIDSSATGTVIDDLVINNFPDDGVLIKADDVTLEGNFIGTDAAGDFPRPNQGFGVKVQGNGDQLGAVNVLPPHFEGCVNVCNLISGNAKANIVLDTTASSTRVEGNYIGTDETGEHIMPSAAPVEGVIDHGHGDIIGGTAGTDPGGSCSGACNVIAGVGEGIQVSADATGSLIEGNYVGVGALGSNKLVTSVPTSGIISLADGVTIGGTSKAARNVVSGSSYINVLLEGHNSVLEGNLIGTTAAGDAPISGTNWSVFVKDASGPTIGGTTPGAANVIGGGSDSGIAIVTSTGVQIEGNFIGVTEDLQTSLGNGDGVTMDDNASGNAVGGTAQGAANTIADSGYGVYINGVTPTVHHDPVRGNSIYNNSSKGIYLENGANDGIQPPLIDSVGPLHGTACANCTIEVFSDDNDEGRIFEGRTTANNAGDWTFNGSLTGPNATATATDLNNNTSEFSQPVSTFVEPTPTPSPSPTPISHPTPTPSGAPGLKGDGNCNDMIDADDALDALEVYAGVGATPACADQLDVNCDGVVDPKDALSIVLFAGGTPRAQPSGCGPIGA